MPFKSKSQQGYLYLNKPKIAEEFAEKTTKKEYEDMPEHVAKDKNGLKAYTEKHKRKKYGKD